MATDRRTQEKRLQNAFYDWLVGVVGVTPDVKYLRMFQTTLRDIERRAEADKTCESQPSPEELGQFFNARPWGNECDKS